MIEAKSCRQREQQSFNYIILSCCMHLVSRTLPVLKRNSTVVGAPQDKNEAKITQLEIRERQSFFARFKNCYYVCYTGYSLARNNESSAFTAWQKMADAITTRGDWAAAAIAVTMVF